VFSLAPGLEIGIVLLGCAAGAPFLLKLSQAANSDIGLSATLLVLLVPVSVVFMPLSVPWLAPEAHVTTGPVARQLTTTLILPLVIGLIVKATSSRTAEWLRPIMAKISTTALIVLLAATVVLDFSVIVAIGIRAILAALMLILGGFAIGYVLARPERRRRAVLGLGTAQRGVAAATLVASQDIDDPDALVMVVVTSLVGMLVLFPIAHWLRRS
jgi:bile acid:Na+ symporter, BASS family